MAYGAEISREHPTCFLFVIDQSGSMDERMESGRSKAQFVADVLNKTLYTLFTTCQKADGVRNYFDVGVLAYSGDSVGNGFGGALANSAIQPIKDVADAPIRVEERSKKVDDGAGGVVDQKTKFPIWFDPRSSGGTPMCAALTKAAEIVAGWCDQHPGSYPPTILHVTDGVSTDGTPEQIAEGVRQLATSDGTCLLFNLHVTVGGEQQIIFPTTEGEMPNEYARLLFRMSSELPTHLVKAATGKGYKAQDGARGFIFNAGPEFIVDFFDIGTRARVAADR
jgi:hypothetical protein